MIGIVQAFWSARALSGVGSMDRCVLHGLGPPFFWRGGQSTLIDMQSKHWMAVGAAVGVGVLLLASRKTEPKGNEISTSNSDLDNTARMLIAETGFNRDKNEMAQIVWVAINRSRGRKVSLSQVTIPPGIPVWNGGAAYRTRFYNADSDPRFPAAKAFVASVLAGEWPELIGGRRMFVHPSGMPTPPCASNRVAAPSIAGTRCLPTWALNGKVVGGALFA
jgi:outer membrane murein-binding lipoprotein Lpp